MNDDEFEALFSANAGPVAPSAAFEDELLLRMRDELSANGEAPSGPSHQLAPARPSQRRVTRSRLLLAACVVLIAGVLAPLLFDGSEPASTAISTTDDATGASFERAVDEVCAEHLPIAPEFRPESGQLGGPVEMTTAAVSEAQAYLALFIRDLANLRNAYPASTEGLARELALVQELFDSQGRRQLLAPEQVYPSLVRRLEAAVIAIAPPGTTACVSAG